MGFLPLCYIIVTVSIALWLLQALFRKRKDRKRTFTLDSVSMGVVDKTIKVSPDLRTLVKDIAMRLDRIEATPDTENELEDLQVDLDMIINPKNYR